MLINNSSQDTFHKLFKYQDYIRHRHMHTYTAVSSHVILVRKQYVRIEFCRQHVFKTILPLKTLILKLL